MNSLMINNSDIQLISLSDIINTPTVKAKWMQGYNSPYYFIKNFLSPRTFEISQKHPKQMQFLHQATNSLEGILCCASRSGKTQALAFLHLWFLFYRKQWHTSAFYNDFDKKFQTLNTCLTVDQSKLVMDAVLDLVDTSPFFNSFPFIQKVDRGQNPSIETCLNSSLDCRATSFKGRNILGSEYMLISQDEAASEPDLNHLRYRTVGTRRTSVSGRYFLASTPTGNTTFREYWYEYKERKKQGEPVCLGRFSKFDNPINNPEQISFEMQSMTQVQITEEVEGKFSDYSSTYFNPQDIILAFQPDLPIYIPKDDPATGNCDPYSFDPRNRHKKVYFSGLDTAGQGQDHTVLITLEHIPQSDSLTLVAYERVSKVGLLKENGIIQRVKRRFSNYGTDNHSLFYDASSMGGGQLSELLEEYLTNEQYECITGINSSRKPGRSTHNHKYHFLSNLFHLLEKNRLFIPDNNHTEQLKKELRFYQYPDDDKLSTDTVMSLGLAAYAYEYYKSDNPNMSGLLDLLNGNQVAHIT